MEAHTADIDESEGAAGGRGGILTCDDLMQQEKGVALIPGQGV